MSVRHECLTYKFCSLVLALGPASMPNLPSGALGRVAFPEHKKAAPGIGDGLG